MKESEFLTDEDITKNYNWEIKTVDDCIHLIML
jgi:hypothetical protein